MSWGPGVEVRKGYIECPYLSSEQVKKVDALLEPVTNSVSKLEVRGGGGMTGVLEC